MKRLLLPAVLAALAAVGTGCDLSPPAATVGGHTVTRSQLDHQLSVISGSAAAQCALQLQGVNLPTPLTGAGDGTVSSTFASYELSTLVLEQLIGQDLARRHEPVSNADVKAAATDFVAQLSPSAATSSPCGISGQDLVKRLPAPFAAEQVAFLAAQERLAAVIGHVDVGQAALAQYYAAHPAEFQEVCLSDIAVTTQAAAQQIHDAIASGSSTFAAEARQSSIDTQTAPNGGQIPCVPSSQIVNSVILGAIAGLGPGQLSAPVFEPQAGTTGSGVWFVLRVDARPLVPLSQAASRIRQQLLSAQNTAVSAEFTRITRAADVRVDPRYGSWSPTQGIHPPPTPRPSILLSPSADQSGPPASGTGTPTG